MAPNCFILPAGFNSNQSEAGILEEFVFPYLDLQVGNWTNASDWLYVKPAGKIKN